MQELHSCSILQGYNRLCNYGAPKILIRPPPAKRKKIRKQTHVQTSMENRNPCGRTCHADIFVLTVKIRYNTFQVLLRLFKYGDFTAQIKKLGSDYWIWGNFLKYPFFWIVLSLQFERALSHPRSIILWQVMGKCLSNQCANQVNDSQAINCIELFEYADLALKKTL